MAISDGYVNSPIFGEIDLAPAGHPFSDLTYSMILGERKNANLTIKPRTRADWIKRKRVDMMDAEVDIEEYQVGLQQLMNWLWMCKNGLIQARFKLPDGKWANFVENVGNNIGTPVGSTMFGGTFDYICSDKERSIKAKLMGGMYKDNEYTWYNTNSNSAATGGSGGTALSGFAHTHYNLGDVGAPGIVSVTVGSDHFTNIADGSSVTLAFTPLGKKVQPRDQPILMNCEPKISLEVLNSDFGTQAAIGALMNTDQTWTIAFAPTPDDITAGRPNMTIVIDKSVFINETPTYTETTEFTTKVELEGLTPIDSPVWAGNNIIIDLVANSITLKRIGVA